MSTNDSGINDENQTTQTPSDNTQTETETDDSNKENENQTDKEEDKDSENTEEENVLDLSKTTSFSMLVGESITLSASIDGCDVWYEIQSGDDVISCDSDFITAISVGTAILKATDWNDESRTWKCTIIVSVEGFTGTALDYKLIGKWLCDDSYIELNSDMTGYMKVYLNGSVVQDCEFTWNTMEVKGNKYLDIANGTDYINKSYTILKMSEVEFRIKGYLGFGLPEETTWLKEQI